MSDADRPLDPEEALADIRTLARLALQSGDKAVMTRDLEMILTIVEMVLPFKRLSQTTPEGHN
jgi:Asp-tRNA(Asn)/Glu-tRNA(Gln) amidotransferase C subunit